MDSLSSAPGNRNNNRLLSAAFAIAASVSGAVNAATTPNFTEEPAGSPKVVNAASAQKAILDMLPADHKSRPGIAASIKALEDGGNVQELTNLFIWAKTIADSPSAPPAAKEKAKEILDIITQVPVAEKQSENAEEPLIVKQPVRKPLPGSKEELEMKKRERLINDMISDFNKATQESKNWGIGSQGNQDVEIKGKSGKILIKYKERRGQQNIANKNAVGVISGRLVPGDYDFNINSSTDGVLWLLDSTGKCINIDGLAPEKGQERIPLAKGMQRVRIPANCTKFTIGFFTNPLMPEVSVEEISAKTIEESKVAGN